MATKNYTILIEDGTKTVPGVRFRLETTSGLYRIGAGNLGISVLDTKIVDIAATGITVVGTVAADALSGPLNGTVGAVTAAAGAFTTGAFSGVATFAAGAVDAPSLARTGDPNTGFWFPGADTIAASVNGVEGLRLTTTGLGIGTTPDSPLHVYVAASAATVHIQSNTATTSARIKYSAKDAGGVAKSWLVGLNAHGVTDGSYIIYDATNEIDALVIQTGTGVATLASLAGVGTRTVVVDANGVLSAP